MAALDDAIEFQTSTKTAYLNAVNGKSYALSTSGTNRSFTRQEINDLKSHYEYWCKRVSELSRGDGMKVRYARPLDTKHSLHGHHF